MKINFKNLIIKNFIAILLIFSCNYKDNKKNCLKKEKYNISSKSDLHKQELNNKDYSYKNYFTDLFYNISSNIKNISKITSYKTLIKTFLFLNLVKQTKGQEPYFLREFKEIKNNKLHNTDSLIEDFNEDLIMYDSDISGTTGFIQYKIEKFNSSGNHILGRRYRDFSFPPEFIRGLIKNNNDSLAFTSNLRGPESFGGFDVLLGIVDINDLIPQRTILYGTPEDETPKKLLKFNNNDILIGIPKDDGFVLIRLLEDLTQKWQFFFQSDSAFFFNEINIDKLDNIYIAGEYVNPRFFFMLILNVDGEKIDFKVYDNLIRVNSKEIINTEKNETIVLAQTTDSKGRGLLIYQFKNRDLINLFRIKRPIGISIGTVLAGIEKDNVIYIGGSINGNFAEGIFVFSLDDINASVFKLGFVPSSMIKNIDGRFSFIGVKEINDTESKIMLGKFPFDLSSVDCFLNFSSDFIVENLTTNLVDPLPPINITLGNFDRKEINITSQENFLDETEICEFFPTTSNPTIVPSPTSKSIKPTQSPSNENTKTSDMTFDQNDSDDTYILSFIIPIAIILILCLLLICIYKCKYKGRSRAYNNVELTQAQLNENS
ncbi:MAG: hypothetical protein GY830_09975 [Bacteroidetes bacterium]|nr:hypothetical protein [Bacteroidota bacterium]